MGKNVMNMFDATARVDAEMNGVPFRHGSYIVEGDRRLLRENGFMLLSSTPVQTPEGMATTWRRRRRDARGHGFHTKRIIVM